MGIIKKIFKGVGKIFKKIGKGIKKAFGVFGKFMGKIGFVGQLAMMFLFPAGIGSMFLKGLGKLGANLAAVTGNSVFSAAARGIGNILTKAKNFVTAAKSGFSSITNGIKEFGKTALNKFGEATGMFQIDGAAQNFFGTGSAMERTAAGFGETKELFRGLRDGSFELKEAIDIDKLSNKVGISAKDLKSLNPDMKIINGAVQPMESLNLDLAGGLKIDFQYQSQANIQNILARGTSPASMGQAEVFAGDGLENYLDQQKSYGNVGTGAILEEGAAVVDGVTTESFTERMERLNLGSQLKDPTEDLKFKGAENFVAGIDAQTPLTRQESGSFTQNVVDSIIGEPEKTIQKSWFRKGLERTITPFNPAEVGFFKAAQNVGQVASQFAEEDEITYGSGGFIVDAMPATRLEEYQSDAGQAYLDFENRASQNNMLGINPFMDLTRSNPQFPLYMPMLGFTQGR